MFQILLDFIFEASLLIKSDDPDSNKPITEVSAIVVRKSFFGYKITMKINNQDLKSFYVNRKVSEQLIIDMHGMLRYQDTLFIEFKTYNQIISLKE